MVRPGVLSIAGVLLLSAIAPLHALAQDVLLPRIINGEPTDEYEAVGIVGSTLWRGFGTGTLISPTHVLTAAHVAEAIGGATSGIFEVEGGVYQTVAIHIHPKYNSRTLANDIAILELAQPVDAITPALLFTGVPQVGDELILVGYGAGGDAGGADGTFGTKLVGRTTIDAVSSTQIAWVFDDIDEANTAPGDSGGPGFLEIEGVPLIASITSAGTLADAGLGDVATNTRVDAFVDWIAATVLGTMPDDNDCDTDGPASHGHRPRPGAVRPGGHGDRRPGTPRPGYHRPGQRPGYAMRPGGNRRPSRRESVAISSTPTRAVKRTVTAQTRRVPSRSIPVRSQSNQVVAEANQVSLRSSRTTQQTSWVTPRTTQSRPQSVERMKLR